MRKLVKVGERYLSPSEFRRFVKENWLPIREVAKRAGVAKSTIHYYVQQGLLPKPFKTSRQMAYYPPEIVETVKLIKQLQKRFLPLKEIKKILKKNPDLSKLKDDMQRIDLAILEQLGKGTGGRQDENAKRTAKVLRNMGIVGGNTEFDRKIVEIVERMRKAGFNDKRGFGYELLKNYVEICRKLVEWEFAEFNKRVIGKMPADEAVELAKVGIETTSELIKYLHLKFLYQKLIELNRNLRKLEREGEK